MYHQSQYRQRHMSDPNNIDLSTFDHLAQDASQIPLEQLTKSDQVQPWDGQVQNGDFYGQISATGWHLGSPSARPGAMSEPIYTGQAMAMQRTPSYNPSNADSGYVSQPVSAKPEFDNSGFDNSFFPSSPYNSHTANDKAWLPGPRTVVSEGGERLVNRSRSGKSPMAPCSHAGCGRLPKNQSDARSVTNARSVVKKSLTVL